MDITAKVLEKIFPKDKMQKEIKQFFMEKKLAPKDWEVHQLADKLDIHPDKLEGGIYKLVHQLIHKKNAKEKSQKELGIEVEKEHKNTIEKIIQDARDNKVKDLEIYYDYIRGDHTDEIKDYYTRLIKMEEEAKK